MNKLLFAITLLLSLNVSQAEIPQDINMILSDFNSDGCSSYPDGLVFSDPNKWVHCCMVHDMAYWLGGSEKEKKMADGYLNQCVTEETNQFHGNIMHSGVAFGGAPNTPFGWRWGYGWNKGVSYNKLKPEMKEMALEKYDSILDELLRLKGWLNNKQKGFVLARYEFLRHDFFSSKNREYEMRTYDERYEKVKEFLAE